MRRTDRLFEIIQILRSENRVITATEIADRLEVSARTIYRDIQTLQSMRTPIEGEAGVGYLMRQGYDLPALNFNAEEIEAIVVGLSLVAQTGDKGLQKAAQQVTHKIDSIRGRLESLQVSERGALIPQAVDPDLIRRAIREEQKLDIRYCDESERESSRRVRPLAIIYYVHAMLLVTWCELRNDFRHFRVDRMLSCIDSDVYFKGEGDKLRERWKRLEAD
ncbi:MAG: YafY family transcriptional regulator [Gammaproteobacteria bacterium]|nr:YafY family transcriptional regulator [Gammaproteobacteria bacterium]MCP4981424.1 YafY family transcriptional regulator [Gammaproteobacteria bacterium]